MEVTRARRVQLEHISRLPDLYYVLSARLANIIPWRAVIFPPRAKCALTSVLRRREVVRSKHVLALLAMKERNGSLLWVCVQHVSLESINQSQGLPLVSVAQEENIPNQMQHHAVSALLVHIHFCYLRRRKTIALVAPQGSTLVRNSQKSVSTANVSACVVEVSYGLTFQKICRGAGRNVCIYVYCMSFRKIQRAVRCSIIQNLRGLPGGYLL